MSPLEILRAAREKIRDPARWTTEDFAKDADGNPCNWSAREAVCWCALGAVRASSQIIWEAFEAEDILDASIREVDLNVEGVPELNDDLGHASVLALFDVAISRAEAQL